MSAYALVNVEITDSAGFAEYRKFVPATIAAFGGRFLTRGGATEGYVTKSLPEGWHSVTPRLVVDHPDLLVRFIKHTLVQVERSRWERQA